METHPLQSILDPLFRQLAVDDRAALKAARTRLKTLVEEERDILLNRLNPVNSQSKALTRMIHESVTKLLSDRKTQMGGLIAASVFMDVDYCDVSLRTTFFSQNLSVVAEQSKSVEVISFSVSLWGTLLENGCSLVSDVVNAQVGLSIEYVAEGAALRRFCGCLFLLEIFRHSPNTMTSRVEEVLGLLWDVLRDPMVETRLAVAKVLRLAFSQHDLSAYLRDLVQHLSVGLNPKQPDCLHGSLSALIECTPVLYGRPVFRDLVHTAVGLLQKLSLMPTIVRKQLLDLLPLIAEQDGERFIHQILPSVVGITSTIFRDVTFDDCRGHLFLTFGLIGEFLGERILKFLDRLVNQIKAHLVVIENSKKQRRERCPQALTCLARLTKRNPQALRPYVLKMLEEIFSPQTLTSEFAENIAALCAALPEIRLECTRRILSLGKRDLESVAASPDLSGGKLIEILSSLQYPEFSGESMLTFVVCHLTIFLQHSSSEVRRAVVDLCSTTIFSACALEESGGCQIDQKGAIIHSGRQHLELIMKLQSGLIDVAVADPDSDLRLATLQRLDCRYDATLAVHDAVNALFPILSDRLNHRILVLKIIGRVSPRNPASTIPTLRRLVVQSLTECQNLQHDNRKQQEAFVVLGTILESNSTFVQPYLPSILTTIVEQLKSPSAPVHLKSACLQALGKLSPEAPVSLEEKLAETVTLVVPHILDGGSPSKRQEAVKALASIVRSTGQVQVFEEHPALMGSLIEMLHGGFKQAWPLRRDVLALMGVIGAVDPVRIKALDRDVQISEMRERSRQLHLSCKTEEGISQIVVEAILFTLHSHSPRAEVCQNAVSGLVRIMTSSAMKKAVVVGYLPRVVDEILRHINGHDSTVRSKLFRELTVLIATVRHHIRGHLDSILLAVQRHIKFVDSDTVNNIMSLLSELRLCLHEELKPKLPGLLPILISILQTESQSTGYILQCLEAFGKLLEDFLHIVLPNVLDVLTHVNFSIENRVQAAEVICCLSESTRAMSEHSARCIHAFCRVLAEESRTETQEGTDKLHQAAVQGIIAVAGCLGEGFAKFVPLVEPHVMKRVGHRPATRQEFNSAVANSLRGYRIQIAKPRQLQRTPAVPDEPRQTDYSRVRAAVQVTDRTGDDEWKNWLRQLCFDLLQSSPALALRVSTTLAQIHEPFSRQLFHPAFASCFMDMDTSTKSYVSSQLGKIIANDKIPSEVLQELLNLAEFLERERIVTTESSNSLFDVAILADRSEFCNLNSKALHYLEVQFVEATRQFETVRPSSQSRSSSSGRHQIPSRMTDDQWSKFLGICQKLIHQYNVLGLGTCADGILEYVKKNFARLRGTPEDTSNEFTVDDPSMYEKLRWWTESYKAFRSRYKRNPNDSRNVLGVMTALDALGDFRALLETWKQFRKKPKRHDILSCAHFGARAAWLLHSWDDLESAVRLMSSEGYAGATASFYQAVLAVHKGSHSRAREMIEDCRRRLDAELSALFAESYDRAYRHTVGLQQLCELEEILDFQQRVQGKEVNTVPPHLINLWSKRLDLMSEDPSEWQGTLANHSLVVPQDEDLDSWLRFVTICRRSGRAKMSQEVLSTLLHSHAISDVLEELSANPEVIFATIVHDYEMGKRAEAASFMAHLVLKLQDRSLALPKLLSKCHTQLARWIIQENPQFSQTVSIANRIKSHLKQAVELDQNSMDAWHEWAVVQQSLAKTSEKGMVSTYASASMSAFVHSIVQNDGRSVVQDVLGFLSLWFTYGGRPAVDEEVLKAISTVPVTMWLSVVPQIIARLHTEEAAVVENVHKLLTHMGLLHPQALLFPLYVSVHETFGITITPELEARCQAAERILETLSRGSLATQRLIEQGRLVSEEVIRMGILHVEWARRVFEDAYDEFQHTKDVNQLWSTITAFRARIDNPQTPSEENFKQEFGQKFHEMCTQLTDLKNGKLSDVEVVFNQFRAMSTTIERGILPAMLSLDLQYVSPALAEQGNNLSLVVPGQYNPMNPTHCPLMQSFSSTLRVIKSIRRPRRLGIHGNDGVTYKFLLKGHEDMRQDERVMQVLGLVNTLLQHDSSTTKQDLGVVQIPVIPLSDDVGLMTWVDDCTTFYDIIVDQRAVIRLPLNKELVQICAFSDDTSSFTVLQRVEVLEAALECTDGCDIAHSMWTKAPNAEVWIDRRTHYTKTVATMSMLGHVLGLGDRHLQNLMLQNYTGRVIHIDFGDCFESAQNRRDSPEKWPFRLTRMLVKAFEVGGISGMFQHSCVSVMEVQRNGRDSLMAMLEAFVHDPLISWRITETREPAVPQQASAQTAATTAPVPTEAPPHGSIAIMASQGLPNAAASADLSRSLQVGSVMPGSVAVTRTASMRSLRARQRATHSDPSQSRQGERVVDRIRQKLTGTEFERDQKRLGARSARIHQPRPLPTQDQVERLIGQATSLENLAQAYMGWCPFW